MKHPALTRTLAVVLAIFCLVTLIAGAGSLRRTRSDHQAALREQEVLQNRIERADTLLTELEEERADYEQAERGLDEKEDRHAHDASDYRGKLATYTATKAGLLMGREGLEQGSAAMSIGAQQFDSAYALFEKVAMAFEEIYLLYQQAGWSLEDGWAVYYEAEAYHEAGLDEELSELLPRSQVLAAVKATRTGVSGLEEVLRAAAEHAPEGETSAEDLEKALKGLQELLPLLEKLEPETLAYRAVEAAVEQAETLRQTRLSEGADEAQAAAEADAFCQAALGMSLSEAKAWMKEHKPAEKTQPTLDLSGLDLSQLSGVTGELGSWKELLQQSLTVLEEQEQALKEQEEAMGEDPESASTKELLKLLKTDLKGSEKLLGVVSPLMETGRGLMESLSSQMAMGRRAIAAARAALSEARRQMSETEEGLKRDHESLLETKDRLETEQTAIEQRRAVVEAYEDKQSSLRSARAALMSYDEIAAAVDAGGELLESARQELRQRQDEEERQYKGRVANAVLMLASCLTGAVCVAGAFEKPKMKRLWIPAALTVLLAAAGEALSLSLGRRLWYSAIFLIPAAAALIPLTIPGKKKA